MEARRARLDGLTGLRFFAALAVFFFHARGLLPGQRFATFQDAASPGMVGVSFFFILSGFVLTWSWRPRPYTTYVRRRLARIVPATWVASVFALAALSTRPAGLEKLPTVLSVPLLQAWWPSIHIDSSPLPATWSLSVELFFYLLFPAVLFLGRRVPTSARKPAILGLAAAILVWAALNPTDGITNAWATYYCPPARLLEFAIGILLALEVAEGRWPRVPISAAFATTAAAWVVCIHVAPQFQFVAVTILPFVLLIGAVATREASGRPTWLAHPTVEALGRWSFAFYLMHPTIVRLTSIASDHGVPVSGVNGVAFALVVSIAASYCLYTLVERPAERLFSATPTVQLDQPEGSAAATQSPERVMTPPNHQQ